MSAKDWIVTNDGQCEPRPSAREWDLVRQNYYLHQFLTEVLDILNQVQNEKDEWDYLPLIRMRVRQLVMNSYWVRTRHTEPNPQTGVGILSLYDEIGYPLTVQNETMLPGTMSNIHNHGTWGVVTVIDGKEEHTFWRRVPEPDTPDRIELVGRKILTPGEILSFMPNAIHQVKAVAAKPTLSFCMYGDTQPRSRFRFDPVSHTAKHF
jgi:predicted metal-dependent enzyme (double-stranded beta helix superfamily)